ncbi:MAG: DUF192 domain-containing protein, partial [Bdellovibrionia bacterium]
MRVPQRFLLVFVPWSVFWQQSGTSLRDHVPIDFGFSASRECTGIDKVYHGKVALRATTQSYGLSHRTKPLNDDDAMLFINPKPKAISFWMFKTHIPLDIAYYDSRGLMRGAYYMPVEQDPL